MKRSSLKRKAPLRNSGSPKPSAPLQRKSALERGTGRLKRAVRQGPLEPGEAEWKAGHRGCCDVCGKPGRMNRHHVLREQDVRKAGGDPWDLRNAIDLGNQYVCSCHHDHHHHSKRISMRHVPDDAVDFAAGLLGAGPTYEYFRRHYAGADNDRRIVALLTTHEEGKVLYVSNRVARSTQSGGDRGRRGAPSGPW